MPNKGSAPQKTSTLDEILAVAPEATAWLATVTDADRTRLTSLALDLGARFLSQIPMLPCYAAVTAQHASAPASSAEKGAVGEELVYNMLSRSRRVRDVSRRAHSGDMVIDSAAGPVYIEVKNYATTVPSAEVEKFLRDLLHRDAAAGVMLSLTSPIVGQRESIRVALEPRVSAGTLVPVVYASVARGGSDATRLSPDVALAVVDMAVCLAETYPKGIRGLQGRSTALSYAIAAEQLAEGAASIRTELARVALDTSGAIAGLSERLIQLGREARELAKGQRSEIEDVRETTSDAIGTFVAELREKYNIIPSNAVMISVVRAIESSFGGSISANKWRLLKTKANHESSGCSIAFLKGATWIKVPVQSFPMGRFAELVKKYSAKISLSDGEVSIEIDDVTSVDIPALVRANP